MKEFLKSEIINDYKCDACSQKGISKRVLLSAIPNVLAVQLCRFDFDLTTFQRKKINSRFEVPAELNLEPYTVEGIKWRENQEKQKQNTGMSTLKLKRSLTTDSVINQFAYSNHGKEYYTYKLKGMVIHSGNA